MSYYKVKKGTVELNIILRSDGKFIPKDAKNADYRKFLESGAQLQEAE